jgi:DNA-binding winged helix-turn-helix (wHTH) protein
VNATEKLLRFGVYELNLETEELRKEGTLLKLLPQPSKLLVLLASHAGHIVTRDDIQKQLWGDETFVDFDQGVNKSIKQIRAILNDNVDKPTYVETLPRRGYRFVAPVVSKTVAGPAPKVTQSSSDLQSRPAIPATPQAGGQWTAAASAPESARDTAAAANSETAAGGAPTCKSGHRIRRGAVAWVAAALLILVAGGLYLRSKKATALTAQHLGTMRVRRVL